MLASLHGCRIRPLRASTGAAGRRATMPAFVGGRVGRDVGAVLRRFRRPVRQRARGRPRGGACGASPAHERVRALRRVPVRADVRVRQQDLQRVAGAGLPAARRGDAAGPGRLLRTFIDDAAFQVSARRARPPWSVAVRAGVLAGRAYSAADLDARPLAVFADYVVLLQRFDDSRAFWAGHRLYFIDPFYATNYLSPACWRSRACASSSRICVVLSVATSSCCSTAGAFSAPALHAHRPRRGHGLGARRDRHARRAHGGVRASLRGVGEPARAVAPAPVLLWRDAEQAPEVA